MNNNNKTPKMKIESNLSSGYLVFSFFNNKNIINYWIYKKYRR